MANREALRELQTRLASRLQTAKMEGLSISWLAVRAGGSNYLFPLAQSGEIFPLADIQVVPYVRPWFLGVVNLRGGLYGVVDLAAFTGSGSAVRRPESQPGEASVVTFNAALEVNSALLVDALAGLRHVETFTGSEPPAASAPPYFGNRYVDASGEYWQEINLQLLSQLPEFLSISA
ncbi:MAG: chemotaxis protein CheW [Curvibacter sp. PD_MW3]|nr:MAG: chemotaxis protein CheW [Curvibacter sp. PD_MW3]